MAQFKPLSPPDRRSVPEDEIIFSLRDGYVWASWPGTNASVRLGRYEMVPAMMRDFLEQDALGQRMMGSPISRHFRP
ncbi:hypothetical protein LZ016_07875 [Sphingomonas sp. SM33]|jgi:hypothetical protein|uniref:Uncharacterized protein n=1 Tax=Sphingomonas telluris TaxID=2907998 RepID=A0ABS9VM28_9SPHN|nr:hypothetical protein [Sphingomonas telluris]MCH8616016.1 hypothetical protein [Sphingomonas telluris]